MRLLYKLFLFLFLFCIGYANNDLIESQPEILFKYDKLKKSQNNLALQVDFNKAVLLLNKGKYKESIELFKQTSRILTIPSFLNIGIAYYKLDRIDKAIIYLNNIYKNKKYINSNAFSYMTACFYLHKISKNKEYLNTIIKVSKKFKNLSEHTKRLLIDTYILLKSYKNALSILDSMSYSLDLKKALLYIKLKDYVSAKTFLKIAKNKTVNSDKIDKILWLLMFIDLKTNSLKSLKENLDLINKRRYNFKANLQLPLEIYFNKDKYSAKQYLNFVLHFDRNREIDFIYYFAPFIFSDTKEIIYDSLKGFIGAYDLNLKSLEKSVSSNGKILKLIKQDPIIRVNTLKQLLKKNNSSYINYNLGLAYAHIFDYYNAFKYFKKAYMLNPGNKLYASMLLITAKRIHKNLKNINYIERTIKSNSGLYNYFGKELYKYFIDKNYKFSDKAKKYKNTIFYKALDFLKIMREKKSLIGHSLLDEHFKDPLTYLIRTIQRKNNENDFKYFSRLQDTIPISINNNFLFGSFFITRYYIDILKAIGLFFNADLNIIGDKSPSHLITRAVKNLYQGSSDETIKIIEYLKKEYNLEDKYTMYLQVAAYLQAGRYNDASIEISLIKALLNDPDTNFLIGVQLIQELKISSAKLFFNRAYEDTLIDFRLIGFDDYLETL